LGNKKSSFVNKSVFATLLGFVFASPLSIAVTGIIFAIVFFSSLGFLIYYGLVSTLIYGFGAFLLVAFIGLVMGKDALQNHWHSFLFFVALVPSAMLFGWFSDRMGSFGLSLIPTVSQNFILSQNAWGDGEAAMISGAYIIGLAALALAIFTAAMVYFKSGKRRKLI
jgi:hypothetical protein